MIYPIVFAFGLITGWITAAKRGGKTADRALYGVVFGMIAMVATLFIILIIGKFI